MTDKQNCSSCAECGKVGSSCESCGTIENDNGHTVFTESMKGLYYSCSHNAPDAL